MKHQNILKGILPSILLVALVQILVWPVMAQEEPQAEGNDKQAARPAFESPMLFEGQTVVVPSAKTLEFVMQHRFGTLENGITDFWGIYGAANIRLGMNYTVIKNLTVGTGFTKKNKYVDLNVKYSILQQTRSSGMPVSIVYYGNVAIDTRDKAKANFQDDIQRLSYFHEIMFARRFSPKISLQLTPSFSHYNAVDTLFSNDIFALSLSGRYKFSGQSSFIFEYDQQLTDHDDPNFTLQPNLTVGVEIATSSHAFQLFFGNFQGILHQDNMVFNENTWGDGVLIGFNITRLWNF